MKCPVMTAFTVQRPCWVWLACFDSSVETDGYWWHVLHMLLETIFFFFNRSGKTLRKSPGDKLMKAGNHIMCKRRVLTTNKSRSALDINHHFLPPHFWPSGDRWGSSRRAAPESTSSHKPWVEGKTWVSKIDMLTVNWLTGRRNSELQQKVMRWMPLIHYRIHLNMHAPKKAHFAKERFSQNQKV